MSTGFSDMTQCWSCAGGVFNWRPDEDPTSLHDELYPSCQLAKERCNPGKPSESRKRERPSGVSEQRSILELPLAKVI